MAKRRPDDALLLLHEPPSKKHCRASCKLDVRVEGTAPIGGLNSPSVLTLLGSRPRKRPHYFEDLDKGQQDEEPSASPCHRHTRKHAEGGQSIKSSGSCCERRSSIGKKRTRDDEEKVDADVKTEDCTYNSFQYWRVPLPQLDLSLLEEASSHSKTEDKSKCKNVFFEAMET